MIKKSSVLLCIALCFMFSSCTTAEKTENESTDMKSTEPREQKKEEKSAESASAEAMLEGTWLGKISAGGAELRIVFNIAKTESSDYTGTMDSPDQNVKGIPISGITVENNSIEINISAAAVKYIGIIKGKLIEGEWLQGGQKIPLNIELAEDFSYGRPQDPVKPYPYIEEEVSIDNNGIVLSGTLTLPETEGPFPAAILISGSGPQNRNEELFDHRSFLVVSDYLTKMGFAVLRYDDRGIGKSTGSFTGSTTYDFASDTEAVFNYLKNDSRINAEKIGLIGHSEGGMIAPLVADRNKEVAFIVFISTPASTGEEISLQQTEAIVIASGAAPEQAKAAADANKQIYAIVKEEKDNKAAADRLIPLLKSFGIPESNINVQLQTLLDPWYREFLVFDPAVYLKKLTVPVLALNGNKDVQVISEYNIPLMEKYLKTAGNSDYTVMELEGLNHLFQTAGTGLMNEYPQIEETFSEKALEIIGSWLKERLLK